MAQSELNGTQGEKVELRLLNISSANIPIGFPEGGVPKLKSHIFYFDGYWVLPISGKTTGLEIPVSYQDRTCVFIASREEKTPTRLLVPNSIMVRTMGIAKAGAAARVAGKPEDEVAELGPLIDGQRRQHVSGRFHSGNEKRVMLTADHTVMRGGFNRGYSMTAQRCLETLRLLERYSAKRFWVRYHRSPNVVTSIMRLRFPLIRSVGWLVESVRWTGSKHRGWPILQAQGVCISLMRGSTKWLHSTGFGCLSIGRGERILLTTDLFGLRFVGKAGFSRRKHRNLSAVFY